MRPQEDWAARCIGHELRVNVVEHDDNSSPGMFDLSIAYPNRPHGAVEVTAAADEESIELGRLAYDGKRWIVEGIVGGWMAGLHLCGSKTRFGRDGASSSIPRPLRSGDTKSPVSHRTHRTLAVAHGR